MWKYAPVVASIKLNRYYTPKVSGYFDTKAFLMEILFFDEGNMDMSKLFHFEILRPSMRQVNA